nr:hypothetical protein [Tanacetum cinerariifolium]
MANEDVDVVGMFQTPTYMRNQIWTYGRRYKMKWWENRMVRRKVDEKKSGTTVREEGQVEEKNSGRALKVGSGKK